MDLDLDLSDLVEPNVTGERIEWKVGNISVRLSMNAAERVQFLNEWLEAEEDHEEGRMLAILRYLADERNAEVSERDPGPCEDELDGDLVCVLGAGHTGLHLLEHSQPLVSDIKDGYRRLAEVRRVPEPDFEPLLESWAKLAGVAPEDSRWGTTQ